MSAIMRWFYIYALVVFLALLAVINPKSPQDNALMIGLSLSLAIVMWPFRHYHSKLFDAFRQHSGHEKLLRLGLACVVYMVLVVGGGGGILVYFVYTTKMGFWESLSLSVAVFVSTFLLTELVAIRIATYSRRS